MVICWGFKGRSALRKFLRSKEHLDWLKIDLNAAEIITVQDYKQKNICFIFTFQVEKIPANLSTIRNY